MRTAESINLVVFSSLVALALVRLLPTRRRTRAVAIGITGLSLIWASQCIVGILPPLAVSVIRDWLPSPLLLLVYWQSGQFFVTPRAGLQARLLELDRNLLGSMLCRLRESPRWMPTYFELSYLFCYLLVPSGVGVLYIWQRADYADTFWMTVLPPTYACYLMVPFCPMLPPRTLEAQRGEGGQGRLVRLLNLWILQHGSIHANTFPSAHVAASFATALALFPISFWTGLVFLWIAASIAVGAVMGRYHYLLDVILGAVLAAASFMLQKIFV